jgi:hypothetical protein
LALFLGMLWFFVAFVAGLRVAREWLENGSRVARE